MLFAGVGCAVISAIFVVERMEQFGMDMFCSFYSIHSLLHSIRCSFAERLPEMELRPSQSFRALLDRSAKLRTAGLSPKTPSAKKTPVEEVLASSTPASMLVRHIGLTNGATLAWRSAQ